MEKITTFNSFAEMFFGIYQATTTDVDFYNISKNNLKSILSNNSYSKEQIYNDVVFFALYTMHKLDLTNEQPIATIKGDNLPSKFNLDEIDKLIDLISIIVEHFENAASEIGIPTPIINSDFHRLIINKNPIQIDIPQSFFNT